MSDLGNAIRTALVGNDADFGETTPIHRTLVDRRMQLRLIKLLSDVSKPISGVMDVTDKIADDDPLYGWIGDPRNDVALVGAVEQFVGARLTDRGRPM